MTLELADVTVAYDEMPVLESVSLAANSGQLLGLLGPNGSGKTTLLRAIVGMVDLDEGQISLDGMDLTSLSREEIAREIGYLQQVSDAARPTTVFDTVLLGRNPHFGWRPDESDRAAVHEVLARLDLEDLAMRELGTLSGGQLRMVLLARALVQARSGLLLDEPTSGLDLKHQHAVMGRVREAVRTQELLGIVAIHDLSLATQFCDQYALLYDRGIYAAGGDEILTPDTLEAVYDVPVEIIERNGHKHVLTKPENGEAASKPASSRKDVMLQ